ncbi:hypothetical protein ACLOJK_013229 [Asimina triloba]
MEERASHPSIGSFRPFSLPRPEGGFPPADFYSMHHVPTASSLFARLQYCSADACRDASVPLPSPARLPESRELNSLLMALNERRGFVFGSRAQLVACGDWGLGTGDWGGGFTAERCWLESTLKFENVRVRPTVGQQAPGTRHQARQAQKAERQIVLAGPSNGPSWTGAVVTRFSTLVLYSAFPPL